MTIRYETESKHSSFKPAIILHGGAGNITRPGLPPERYERYRSSLLTYLRSTYNLLNSPETESYGELDSPSSALNAAVHAVSLMEDDELFNCGRGSVFTRAGTIEMEASVMVCSLRPESSTPDIRRAEIKRGAGVMMVKNVRHPIRLAREVLLRNGHGDDDEDETGGSMHSQLCGPYVETLARDWGLEFKPDEWFWTKKRWDEHQRGLKGRNKIEVSLDHDGFGNHGEENNEGEAQEYLSQGTVGCVCLDKWGNIAVATSTGGMTNKFPGRIGDTPTLGAGFWAEDWNMGYNIGEIDVGISNNRQALAISGTGNGDSFLRLAAARTAAALVRFNNGRFSSNARLAEAVTAIAGPGGELEKSAGPRWGISGEGEGGMIGIEARVGQPDDEEEPPAKGEYHGKGTVVFDFNCGGMFRAWIEEGHDGVDRERMMVFRDEYHS